MAPSYTKESVNKLKSEVDIVDVIGRVVSLKRAGDGYKGLCPFHNEKTPSFVVSQSKQIYKCFGCSASGDVISFVEKYYNLPFSEAVEKISQEEGIPIEQVRTGRSYDVYYEANRIAGHYYCKNLFSGQNRGYSYVTNRGVSNEILKKFGIGYALPEWKGLYNHLSKHGIPKNVMLELGLIIEKSGNIYDRFRDRLMFPILDTSGHVIGFGGRALDKNATAKYLNSPESVIFHKSKGLYGFNFARDYLKEAPIIVVEGYMDVVSLHQYGVKNVCASLGTALTKEHGKFISRYTKDVILSYDGDEAGQKASIRAYNAIREGSLGFDVKVLSLPDNLDPDEYIRKFGKEEFIRQCNEASSFFEFYLKRLNSKFDIKSYEGKLSAIDQSKEFYSEIKDPLHKYAFVQELARVFEMDEGVIQEALTSFANKHNEHRHESSNLNNSFSSRSYLISNLEKNLVKLLVNDELADSTYKKLKANSFIFSSLLGQWLYSFVGEMLKRKSNMDIHALMDRLAQEDETLISQLEKIINGPSKADQQVLEDCMEFINRKQAQELIRSKEKELQIFEEQGAYEEARRLQSELLNLRKEKLVSVKAEENISNLSYNDESAIEKRSNEINSNSFSENEMKIEKKEKTSQSQEDRDYSCLVEKSQDDDYFVY